MGMIAGVAGLAGGLMGMFGGGSDQPAAPNVWQAPNMNQTAGNYLTGVGNLSPYTNLGQFGLGAGQNIFNTLANNPGAAGYFGGAQTAGAMGQAGALGQFGAGQALTGAGLSSLPYAQSIFNTAMDPQMALYNRTLQQVTDQSRAGLESRGLDMTPYGAGVEGQTLSNFNIDWQNQQLMRQIQGAQGAGNVLQHGGNAIAQGAGLTGAAPGQFFQASGWPYGVFQGMGQDQFGNLSNLMNIGGQGFNFNQGQLGDWAQYLQIGNQSNANAIANYQAQLQAQKQQFQENQIFGSQIGNSLYGLGMGGFGMSGLMGGLTGGLSSPNMMLPGGVLSPFNSYVGGSGDLISAGMVTPG